jgi:hypothetical protein
MKCVEESPETSRRQGRDLSFRVRAFGLLLTPLVGRILKGISMIARGWPFAKQFLRLGCLLEGGNVLIIEDKQTIHESHERTPKDSW